MGLITYRHPVTTNSVAVKPSAWISVIRHHATSCERVAVLAFERWRSSWVSLVSYLTIIGGVSLYDIYLTIRYAESLQQYEANPVGRWLMGLDALARGECPDVSLFVGCKTFGTLVVLAVLALLVVRFARFGHPIAMGVSLFQISLGYFLTFALTSSFE